MNKKFIIPLVSFGVAAGSLSFLALANNTKYSLTKVEATPTKLVFDYDSIDPDYIDDESTEYYKYLEFYMSVETPLGNTFETYIDNGFPCVGADTQASVKTNNKILELEDSNIGGYFSMVFKFELSLVSFDHITLHGYFNYGEGPTETDYITYEDIDESGYVVVSLNNINSAYISTMDVVYSC